MPNPSTIAMQDEKLRTLLELTQGEVEALEYLLKQQEKIAALAGTPEEHANTAYAVRALRKVLNYGE